MLILGAGMICAAALAAPPKSNKPANPAAAKAVQPANYVGSDTCATCHDEVSKKFAANPHTKMALMHGSSGITCENCHGPGADHVAGGGDVSKIFDPAKASAKDVDAKCLGCHAGAHPNFERSPHAKAGLGCISCHSIHGSDTKSPLEAAELHLMGTTSDVHSGEAKDELLKAPQPTLCYQCHNSERAQFNMPVHHRVNEGLVQCSDCHDVHGSFAANNLKSTADQNMVCTKCHADVRGPFVYEHAPVKAEGCMACHTPHGSQNPRMLNLASINNLCNQCHSRVANATIHGMGAGSDELAPCTSCHTYIHGSNINAAFLR
jgi:predicted CXXCH cytochrome family protein